MRKIPQTAIDLIKSFEGLKLVGYPDIRGIPTIGWGHTGPDVKIGMTITPDGAEEFLERDLAHAGQAIEKLVHVQITDNQFAALVSFVFNLGVGRFATSTLLKDINSGDFTNAANEFLRWNHSGGKVIDGLTRRRKTESTLFMS